MRHRGVERGRVRHGGPPCGGEDADQLGHESYLPPPAASAPHDEYAPIRPASTRRSPKAPGTLCAVPLRGEGDVEQLAVAAELPRESPASAAMNRAERPLTWCLPLIPGAARGTQAPTLGRPIGSHDEVWRPAPSCFAACLAELAVTMTSSPTCGEPRDARGAGPVGPARRAECAQPGATFAARSPADRRPARARVARGSAAATRAAAGRPSFLAVQRRPLAQAVGLPPQGPRAAAAGQRARHKRNDEAARA